MSSRTARLLALLVAATGTCYAQPNGPAGAVEAWSAARKLGLERLGPESNYTWITRSTGQPWFFMLRIGQPSDVPEAKSVVSLMLVNCRKLETANTMELYFEDANAFGVVVKHQDIAPLAPGLNPMPMEVGSFFHTRYCRAAAQ